MNDSNGTMTGMICRVRAIVKRGDQLLLVRQRDHAGVPKPFWALPGGHVEDGEKLHDALRRELIEETGIEPVVGKLLFVHQFASAAGYEGPEFFFYVENAQDFVRIDLAQTSHGAHEIAEIGFFDPRLLDVVLPGFLKDITQITPDVEAQLIVRARGDA